MTGCLLACFTPGKPSSRRRQTQGEDEVVQISGSSSDGSDDLNTKRPLTPTSQAVPDKGKKKQRQVEADEQWTCNSCTFINEGGAVCESCRSTRAQQDGTGAWACQRCTFVNDSTLPTCELCQTPRTSAGGSSLCEVVFLDGEAAAPEAWSEGSSNPGAGPSSGFMDEDLYVLDICGCRHNRAALEGRVGVLEATLPHNLGALLVHICCPAQSCHQPLSRNDLCNLMHPAALKKMDQRICAAALREAAIQARRSRENLQDFAAMPLRCPICSDAPEMLSLAATASLTLAELQGALRARSIEKPPRRISDAAAQLKGLCSGAAHVCLTCSAGISRLSGEIISTDSIEKAPCGKASASEAAAAGRDRCLRLCSLIFQLHCALTNDQRVVNRVSEDKKAPPKARMAGNGTGYGGAVFNLMGSAGASWATAAAAKRQAHVDTSMTRLLADIRVCLEMGPARRGGMPSGLCALVQASSLGASIRLLLQNDSLMDIGSRGALYLELIQLLRKLGAHIELLPVLRRPADLEQDPAGPSGRRDSSAAAVVGPAAPSPMDALTTLNTQCSVFKRSAQELAGSGDDSSMEALSVALEISATYEQLSESVALFNSAVAVKPAETATGQPLGIPLLVRPADAQAALEIRYVDMMTGLRFKDHELIDGGDFYFRSQAKDGRMGGAAWLRRIVQEHSSLATCLPVSWSTSIFLAVDSSHVNVLRALIIGPGGTPYANGCFLFDILLPPEYPNKPPQVQFLTTGAGSVRFNPNLYNNGMVCLSLLGTWSGPSWNPGTSTLLQVLVSIQSMILVEDPYFNEPGWECSRNTPAGAKASQAYNANIRKHTLEIAVLGALNKPNTVFADVIRAHFRMKKTEVLAQCQQWSGRNNATHTAIEKALEGLTE